MNSFAMRESLAQCRFLVRDFGLAWGLGERYIPPQKQSWTGVLFAAVLIFLRLLVSVGKKTDRAE